MKKAFSLLLGTILLAGACCPKAATTRAIPQDKEIERKIDSVMKKLTLVEKIGQMGQINADMLLLPGSTELSPAADVVLRKYKVGSILNTLHGTASTPEVYREFIGKIQQISLEETGIPCLYGLDQIHGASYTTGAILFPQELTLAASFNDRLAYEMGRICAYETRACNVPWVFTPTLDLSRNQCWPRMWESYGEDPYVQARMGVQQTLGLQGPDPNHIDAEHVAVSIKHFMAYGASVSGQDRTPAMVSKRELKEKYFVPFKACIEAGALTLMVNSSSNDGEMLHASKELLTGWAKESTGWDGMIVTDGADIRNLWERDHVAADYKDALRLAINAGVDMIMEPYDCKAFDLLRELVEEGKVPESRIDDACRRVLRVKFRLGLFDDPYGLKGDYSRFACEEFRQTAYQAALESEVLLKNEDNILPLSKDTRILRVGPNADVMRPLGGGWNYSWQGDAANDPQFTGQYNTIREALEQKFAKVTYVPVLEYDPAGDFQAEKKGNMAKALAASVACDVIVACIGENTYCETVGNINDLTLSRNQIEMVQTLAKTGKPVVLVLNEGRPRIVREIEPLAKAVVDVILPGNYGGDALAALLCGEENFSAKLPFTYPKYTNRLNTYDYKLSENRTTMGGLYNYDATIEAQWSFGHGLSYTTFEYSNMKADKTEFKAGDVINLSVDVTNTGKRAGKEPVLLFSSDLTASVTPEARRLRDFTKIELQAGETKTVSFSLKAEDLAFVGHDLEWTLEPGEFRLAIGNQSLMLNCVE